jgi:hypothetical protein
MAARAFVFEKPTLGIEATVGGTVSARRTLLSLTGEAQPNTPIMPVEASGFVAPVDVTSGKEWADFDFSAPLSFNDVLFMLAGYAGVPYISPDVTYAQVEHWLFRPKGFNPDTFQSYLLEEGSTGGAQSCPGMFFNSFDLSFDEKKADVKGKGFAQLMTDGITLGTGAVNVPLLPASPDQVNVYVASTYAGLSAGKLTDCLSSSVKMADRQGQIMTLDSATHTWGNTVQKKGASTGQIVVLQDTASNAYMAQLRSKGLGYCRVEALGPVIPGGGALPYRFAVTFPFKFTKSARSAVQDAYAGTYDMQMLYDPTFAGGAGGFVEFAVDTDYSLIASGLTGGTLGSGG